MEFNYKGIKVNYNDGCDKESIIELLDELFEFYYDTLMDVSEIDFPDCEDFEYFLIDGEPYQYYNGVLSLYEGDYYEDDELTESFNSQEYEEFQQACKELGLETFEDITKFKSEHNCKNDKELLQALKDAARGKNECVDDVRFISEKVNEDLFDAPDAEEEVEETKETVNEPKEKEPETFEEKMDFLAADEQEAIDGYEKIIATIDDEHVKEQLNKIMIEEKAHKEYLEKVKKDQSIDYTEPLEDEEEKEEEPEEVEETEKEEIDENLKLREGKEVTDYTWSEICTKMKEEPLIALNGGNNYQYVGKVKDLEGNEKMAVIGVSHSLKDLYNDYPKSKKLKVYIPVNKA